MGLSLAEKKWQQRNQGAESSTSNDLSAPVTTEEDKLKAEMLERLFFVFDQITENVPEGGRDSWQFKTIIAMVKETQKDLKRFPPDVIKGFCEQIGNALLWVAGGSMEDVT